MAENQGTRRNVSKGSNQRPINSSVSGGASYDVVDGDYGDAGGGWGNLRLKYAIPIWVTTAFAILGFLLAAACLGVIVYHNKHDVDAYVCNDDDENHWFCPSTFDPNTELCEPLPYDDWATGGSFQMCFYDICVYFKEWGPVPSYPCADGDVFPVAGKEHCLDFVSEDYDRLNRLEVILYCSGSQAVCIYRDACSRYGNVNEEGGALGISSASRASPYKGKGTKSPKNNKGSISSLSEMNGTNFYSYGSKEALKKSNGK